MCRSVWAKLVLGPPGLISHRPHQPRPVRQLTSNQFYVLHGLNHFKVPAKYICPTKTLWWGKNLAIFSSKFLCWNRFSWWFWTIFKKGTSLEMDFNRPWGTRVDAKISLDLSEPQTKCILCHSEQHMSDWLWLIWNCQNLNTGTLRGGHSLKIHLRAEWGGTNLGWSSCENYQRLCPTGEGLVPLPPRTFPNIGQAPDLSPEDRNPKCKMKGRARTQAGHTSPLGKHLTIAGA